MKRALLFAPFVLLTGLSLACRWVSGGKLLGDAWLAAFLLCLLYVPALSRKKLWLGYAALLFPFGVLAAFLILDWGSLSVGF